MATKQSIATANQKRFPPANEKEHPIKFMVTKLTANGMMTGSQMSATQNPTRQKMTSEYVTKWMRKK